MLNSLQHNNKMKMNYYETDDDENFKLHADFSCKRHPVPLL